MSLSSSFLLPSWTFIACCFDDRKLLFEFEGILTQKPGTLHIFSIPKSEIGFRQTSVFRPHRLKKQFNDQQSM